MFCEVNKAQSSATFTIPREYGESGMNNNHEDARILCTYSSGLITISHRLELEVSTSGCCVTNPSLLIPMLVEEEPANPDAAQVEAEVEVDPCGQASYVPPQYEDAIQSPVIYVVMDGPAITVWLLSTAVSIISTDDKMFPLDPPITTI